VRWPPASDAMSPGAEERLRFCRLRVTVVRSETLVAEARGQFRNPEEGEHPPLEAATKQRLVKTEKTLRVL
jgi:hypothetical protein